MLQLGFGETKMTKSFGMVMLLALAAGCSFHARSPDEYRDATQALLDTKSADIKTCYDTALQGKNDLAGTVTVHFTVEAETGKIGNVTADAAKTQAPDALQQCVVKSLDGRVPLRRRPDAPRAGRSARRLSVREVAVKKAVRATARPFFICWSRGESLHGAAFGGKARTEKRGETAKTAKPQSSSLRSNAN
jgi:hypothetical protein